MTPEQRLQRLQQCIEAFGSDVERWPPSAKDTLAEIPEAQLHALFESELALEDWLAALPEPSLPRGLSARILARAPKVREPLRRQLWRALGGPWLAGPAFAGALSLGLALGLLFPPIASNEVDELDQWLELVAMQTVLEEDLP